MAQLIVRGIDDAVRDALKRRAAEHGRSMEAEAREILTRAVHDDDNAGRVILDLFAGQGIEFDLPERSGVPRSVQFDQ